TTAPVGVAPGTVIWELDFNSNNWDSDIACLIYKAHAKGVNIINMSYSGIPTESNSGCSGAISAMHQALCSTGVTLFGGLPDASGNDTSSYAAVWSVVKAVTAANEFNGYPPNSPNNANPPKTGDQFNGSACGGANATDDYTAPGVAYTTIKSDIYAPVCIWG